MLNVNLTTTVKICHLKNTLWDLDQCNVYFFLQTIHIYPINEVASFQAHTLTLFVLYLLRLVCTSPASSVYTLMPWGLKELRSRSPLICSSTGVGFGCSRSTMNIFPGSSENEGSGGYFNPWVGKNMRKMLVQICDFARGGRYTNASWIMSTNSEPL